MIIATFLFNHFVTTKLITLTCNSKYVQKFRFQILISLSFFLILSHLHYFLKTKETNFFELLGIPRIFTEEELRNRYHYLKSQPNLSTEYQIRIKEAYNVLSNQMTTVFYDKYHKILNDESDHSQFYDQSINYTKLVEHLLEYMIILILFSLGTNEENLKPSRKWIVAFLVLFFSLEINFFFTVRTKIDFFDYIFPKMAIFERITLLRYLTLPLLFTIRNYYLLFYKSPFNRVLEKLNRIKNEGEGIKKKLDKRGGNNMNDYNTFLENINQSLIKMESEKKEKISDKKTSKWKKIIFYIVIGIIVLITFFNKDKEDSSEFYDMDDLFKN